MRNPHDTDVLSQALGEPSRRSILENLRFGEKSVTELVQATHLKQPNVSNHLAKMRQQKLVRAERIGRQVYYSIALPVAELMLRLHEFTTDPLQREPEQDKIPLPETEHVADRRSLGRIQPARAGKPAEKVDFRPKEARPQSGQTAPAEYRSAFFECLMEGQEERALALINAMLARRLSLETIYSEVFQWALNRVGELYAQGVTDEAHEHMASEITERMMAKVAHFYTPLHRVEYRAVLGCVAHNWHVVGLRMLSDSLNALGWATLFLGADVPTSSFAAMVTSNSLDLVVVSCSMAEQVAELQRLIAQLEAARQSLAERRYQIAIGGSYFVTHPERLRDLPLDFTALNLPEFLQAVRARFPIPARTNRSDLDG